MYWKKKVWEDIPGESPGPGERGAVSGPGGGGE